MPLTTSEGDYYSLNHMELLHHFTTSTALTFSSHPDLQTLWSRTIPQLGMSYPFVLQAILALSSMHLARERPSELRDRWACGIELQQQAVARAQQAMASVSAENCTALYLFSALTCIFSLARGQHDRSSLGACAEQGHDVGSFLEWVSLYRGTRYFLGPPYGDILEEGPLGPMFKIGRERKEKLLSALELIETTETAPLEKFRDAIRRHVADATRVQVYDSAIDDLARSFQAVLSRPTEEVESMEVFAWVFAISDDFVELLRERDSIALALFGCFASLIRVLRRRWWADGWGEWCIDLISAELKNADAWILDCMSDVTSRIE